MQSGAGVGGPRQQGKAKRPAAKSTAEERFQLGCRFRVSSTIHECLYSGIRPYVLEIFGLQERSITNSVRSDFKKHKHALIVNDYDTCSHKIKLFTPPTVFHTRRVVGGEHACVGQYS